MELKGSQTFQKAERITSRLVVDKLFEGGSASMVVFPFRVVYMNVPKAEVPASILISIPKKRFHHAVDRNRMKRLVREAYRRQKGIIWDKYANSDESVCIAFICICQKLCTYDMVYKSVGKALNKIAR